MPPPNCWRIGDCLSDSESKWVANRVLTVLLVTLLINLKSSIQEGMKRTTQVNVKMSEEDFALLRKAADKHWPDAVMTNSGIVLALARIAARDILGERKKGRS
jgi:hypothetical protein